MCANRHEFGPIGCRLISTYLCPMYVVLLEASSEKVGKVRRWGRWRLVVRRWGSVVKAAAEEAAKTEADPTFRKVIGNKLLTN